jgi:hypothetical protein
MHVLPLSIAQHTQLLIRTEPQAHLEATDKDLATAAAEEVRGIPKMD